MKVAHIIPPKALQAAFVPHVDYQLVLPQLMSTMSYRRFGYLNHETNHAFTIIDNGAAEGTPKRLSTLDRLRYTYFKRAEIALPDILGDADGTYQASFKALAKDIEGPFMGIMQAHTPAQVEKLLSLYRYDDRVVSLGIPRLLLNTECLARTKMIRLLRQKGYLERFKVHLLGMHPNYPMEPAWIERRFPGMVRGVDSSTAFVLAARNTPFGNAAKGLGRQPDFFVRKWTPEEIALAGTNMERMTTLFASPERT